MSDIWYNTAAWVQAVGTIGAVLGSAWLAASDSRATRRREEAARISAKTAALNLALVVRSQIHNLHRLMRDESRRGRLNHISPSRGFVASQAMLTSFPIQSLEDPDAMVAFSFFPTALAMAGEIYGHLEEAVRAAEEENPAEVFAHYSQQLEMVEEYLDERLQALKLALKLEDGVGEGHDVEAPQPERHAAGKPRRPRRAGTAEA